MWPAPSDVLGDSSGVLQAGKKRETRKCNQIQCHAVGPSCRQFVQHAPGQRWLVHLPIDMAAHVARSRSMPPAQPLRCAPGDVVRRPQQRVPLLGIDSGQQPGRNRSHPLQGEGLVKVDMRVNEGRQYWRASQVPCVGRHGRVLWRHGLDRINHASAQDNACEGRRALQVRPIVPQQPARQACIV